VVEVKTKENDEAPLATMMTYTAKGVR